MNIYTKYNFILLINLILNLNKFNKININFNYNNLNKNNINTIINFIDFININNKYNYIINFNLINIIKYSIKKNIINCYNKKKFFKIINFAYINNIDFNKLKIHNNTYYSITNYLDANYISNIIYKFHNTKNIVITDATANVGGNTISFGLFNYKLVNSIEINTKCYEYLVNNIDCYNLKNIKAYNDNYLNIYKKIYQDVLFIDPPWGGPNYKHTNNLDLYINKKNIIDIISEIYNDTITTSIILKVPFNYNMTTLHIFLKKNKNIKFVTYTLQKFLIIYLYRKI